MSRLSGSQPVYVKPTNNIYTVLAGVAVLAEIIALIVLFLQANALFGKSLFS